MHLSAQKTVLRDRAEGLASQRSGPRGAAANVLTKRLKLRRNIASKAGGAERGSASPGRCGTENRLRCGQAAGSTREAGCPATRPPGFCTFPTPPRSPFPLAARALATLHLRATASSPRRLIHGQSPAAGLGAPTPSLPYIWPQHRHPADTTAARGEGEPAAQGRESGGALGFS